MSKQYLDYIRDINKARASKCYICKKQSTGINAVGAKIVFVCNTHIDNKPRVKVINDMPNVIHRVYPDGLKVDPKMMNPNIGGFLGKAKGNSTE